MLGGFFRLEALKHFGNAGDQVEEFGGVLLFLFAGAGEGDGYAGFYFRRADVLWGEVCDGRQGFEVCDVVTVVFNYAAEVLQDEAEVSVEVGAVGAEVPLAAGADQFAGEDGALVGELVFGELVRTLDVAVLVDQVDDAFARAECVAFWGDDDQEAGDVCRQA
ncbi:hypothetical protein [Deinococcus aquaticus]|uniref:hypothetical protein n=1 Tax=Deinococcus aquaticus TaxID=328692 RepID=UPI003F4546F6